MIHDMAELWTIVHLIEDDTRVGMFYDEHEAREWANENGEDYRLETVEILSHPDRD
jgi:hypothetical protein